MQPKYTYDDWYSGKVNIKGEEISLGWLFFGEIVLLNEFSEDDQNRILNEKEKFAKPIINELFLKYQKSYLDRSKEAKYQSLLNLSELNAVKDVLFGNAPLVFNGLYESNWGENYSFSQGGSIKNLIEKLKKKEEDSFSEYSFVLSPNHEEYSQKISPIFYAKALLLYYNFLKSENVITNSVEKIVLVEKNDVEPDNFNDNVFINGWASELFMKVCRALKNDKKYFSKSSIAFAYYGLKDTNVFTTDLPNKTFVDMVNKLYPEMNFLESDLINRKDKRKIFILHKEFNSYPEKSKFKSSGLPTKKAI